MLPSFQALMSGIIDDAGLFPPARLELTDAFDRYLESSSGADGWMLARFVIPVARLDELSPLIGRKRHSDRPVRLAVIGRGGASPAGFASAITSDVADIRRFAQRHSDRVVDRPARVAAARRTRRDSIGGRRRPRAADRAPGGRAVLRGVAPRGLADAVELRGRRARAGGGVRPTGRPQDPVWRPRAGRRAVAGGGGRGPVVLPACADPGQGHPGPPPPGPTLRQRAGDHGPRLLQRLRGRRSRTFARAARGAAARHRGGRGPCRIPVHAKTHSRGTA